MSSDSSSPKPEVQVLEVDAESAGQRIDNFLTRHLKGVPKSRIYRILRRGEVRVNRGRIRPTYRLQTGDQVRIPPVRTASGSGKVPQAAGLQWLEDCILYEDERLLVLNKPAGMAVHGGSGLSHGVIEALRSLRPNAPYLELVHRLDRDTSGCLMVAKRRSQLRRLHDLLRTGAVDKQYLSLVQGQWNHGTRRVKARLRKNLLRGGERMVQVAEDGKESLSEFRLREMYTGASLMEVKLGTGRTHQIRVHAAHVGHPIAGDNKYGDQAFNGEMARYGLRRLFLHAYSLAFSEPESGRRLEVSAPLGEDLEGVLKRLEVSA